ncbi:MAG: hypothetical protein KDK65_03500 [Chlamydiia bacterium]|nr:hypothetical protein [Chlamydiia bacterium]
MFGQGFVPLTPSTFFHVNFECFWISEDQWQKEIKEKRYRLPSLMSLTDEEQWASVHLGWNEKGLGLAVQVPKPFNQSEYPKIDQGDSVELFIDTRDKSSGYCSQFCHHFFFLPVNVDGIQSGEITRFRSEETHELADGTKLPVNVDWGKLVTLLVWIPATCLHGYDTQQFERLGMTYRINRIGSLSQHLSVVSSEYQVEQQPSMWSSVRLMR